MRDRAPLQEIDATSTLHLHGTSYVINVSVRSKPGKNQVARPVLDVQVEEESSDFRWGAVLECDYIEEITRKTGNFKRFPVFVQMLLSAVSQQSESVFLDLLTYADLEKYKNRKLTGSRHTDPIENQVNQKRYLILTYAVEFDRIHYPLPLQYIDHPSVEMLQRTIMRLRKDASKVIVDKKPEIQVQTLKEENQELKSCYEQIRTESTREICRLQHLLKARSNRRKDLNENDDSMIVQNLRRKLQSVENKNRKQQEKLESANRRLKQELHELNTINEKVESQMSELHLKNKELMRQLAIARKSHNTLSKKKPSMRREISSASDSELLDERTKGLSGNSRTFTSKFHSAALASDHRNRFHVRKTAPRTRRSSNTSSNGYASDRSYASADNDRSRQVNPTRRSRSRKRPSASQQRALDERLSSPKNPRILPRNSKSSRRIYQSASPRVRTTTQQGTARSYQVQPGKRTEHPKNSDLSEFCDPNPESTLESFTDIDSRLNALQKFLREAKGSSSHK